MSRHPDDMEQPDMQSGDDRLDALLRDTLRHEADGVQPAGDGLARIQQRVATRRARLAWLRPAMAVGSAATQTLNSKTPPLSTPTNDADSTPATPSPSVAPVSKQTFPVDAIFPFTNVKAEQTWESEYAAGHQPTFADADATALAWVQTYLQQPTVTDVMQTTFADGGTTAVAELGRVMTGETNKPFAVTDVHEVKFGEAWIVTGASDPNDSLKITSPAAGDTVHAPLTVTGPGYGSDMSATVQVRDATTPTSYGEGHTGSFGNGTPQWSASVPYSQPQAASGVVVAIEDAQSGLGGAAHLAAVPVHFASFGATTPPPDFYAATDNRIAELSSDTGALVSYLTPKDVVASDPQLSGSGEVVYFLQDAGKCGSSQLMYAPVTGGAPQEVASPDAGYRIAGYAVGPAPAAASGSAHPAIALFESSCAKTNSAAQPQGKLIYVDIAGTRHVVDTFPAFPPLVEGDPSFVPGTTESWKVSALDAFVRSGNGGGVARYDLAAGSPYTSGPPACASLTEQQPPDGRVAIGADGTLWVGVPTGSGTDVWRCGPHAAVAFTVPGSSPVADVAATGDGQHVLVVLDDGSIYRWDSGSAAVRLTATPKVTGATW
jgi:hypothetical protein